MFQENNSFLNQIDQNKYTSFGNYGTKLQCICVWKSCWRILRNRRRCVWQPPHVIQAIEQVCRELLLHFNLNEIIFQEFETMGKEFTLGNFRPSSFSECHSALHKQVSWLDNMEMNWQFKINLVLNGMLSTVKFGAGSAINFNNCPGEKNVSRNWHRHTLLDGVY